MMVKFEIEIPDRLVEDYKEKVSLEDKAKADSINNIYIVESAHDCFAGNQDYIDSKVCVYLSPFENSQGIAVALLDCQNKAEICERFVSAVDKAVHLIIHMMDVVNKKYSSKTRRKFK